MSRVAISAQSRTRRPWLLVVIFACIASCLGCASEASAATPRRTLYTIAVGHNAVAEVLRQNAGGLVTLRYADDDALKVYSLMRHASRRAYLLSVLDADTQRRYPELAIHARLPSLAEIERTIESVARAMAEDRAKGEEPELVFFFSGHGVRDESGAASLSILDGALTRPWLYEKVLARIPAHYVHLVIDACHAAALVRPRDASATIEQLDEAERANYLDEATLAQFPHVGAVLASTAGAQSFEWDQYRSGVFAHQFLSGLRGGADVNGDGRVEYSEIAAFLSAANLRVKDSRARLDVVVRPPPQDRRKPLIELDAVGRQFELRGRAEGAWASGFFIETQSGERLLDVFPEQAARLRLRLPAGERLYLVRPDAEVELVAREGSSVAFASLRGRPPRTRPRGALDSALREGLFAARFGPAFYLGYVSQRDELISVPFFPDPPREERVTILRGTNRDTDTDSGRTLGTALLVGGGVAVVVAGVFTGLAIDAKSDYDATDLERPAEEAKQRFERHRTAALVSGGAALALAGSGLVVSVWPRTERGKGSALTIDGVTFGAGAAF